MGITLSVRVANASVRKAIDRDRVIDSSIKKLMNLLQQRTPASRPNNCASNNTKMAASSRRSDYGEEFVERLRRDRFRKEKYILVNGVSSEEEDEELCFDEEDDEIVSNFQKNQN